jgi:hypothetical protein
MKLQQLKHLNARHDAKSFKDLPFGVLNQILAYLPKIDQVCLALTSKALWVYFELLLGTRNLELSRLFPDESQSRCSDTFYSTPRLELLYRIQNNRWKFCRMCWKLHAVSALDISRMLGSNGSLPYKPECMPFPGRVDICLCLKYHPELDIFRTVRYVLVLNGLPRRVLDGWTFTSPERWEGPRHRSHVLAFDGYEYSSLDISTTLYWKSDTNTLLVDSTYGFSDKRFLKKLLRDEERSARRLLAERGIRTSLFYQHDRTQEWLRRFFREAGITDLDLYDTRWTWTSPAVCNECRGCDERNTKKGSFKNIKNIKGKVLQEITETGETGKSMASKFWSNFRKFPNLKRKDVP